MVAGTIVGFGRVGSGTGSGMKRGTIALLGEEEPELLPTFAGSGRHRLPFLAIYLRRLRELGFRVPGGAFAGDVRRYNGDLAAGGQGEILVRDRGEG